MPTHLIPVQPLSALLREWLGDHNTEVKIVDLAARTGLNERHVRSILGCEQLHVTFDTADLLLTRMDLVYLWYTDLAEWYEPPAAQPCRKRAKRAAAAATRPTMCRTVRNCHLACHLNCHFPGDTPTPRYPRQQAESSPQIGPDPSPTTTVKGSGPRGTGHGQ